MVAKGGEKRGMGNYCLMGAGVVVWKDEKCLEIHIWCSLLMPLNYTLKNG